MRPIAWGITGAGHFMEDVFNLMQEASSEVQVTSFVSAAGEEVIRVYGLRDKLHEVSDGKRYSEVFTDRTEEASSIHAGRMARGVYSSLFIAPATANTVAKICRGIADTLVTNAAAQALKGEVPVFILPTDQSKTTETVLPVRVETSLCARCDPCPAEEECEPQAFNRRAGVGAIDYRRCVGCNLCVDACPYGAVRRGERIMVRSREVDLRNVERLRSMSGVTVLRDPGDMKCALLRCVRG